MLRIDTVPIGNPQRTQVIPIEVDLHVIQKTVTDAPEVIGDRDVLQPHVVCSFH